MGIQFLFYVGIGGAIGSICRAILAYFLSSQTLLATILANLGGALLIGCLSKLGENLSSGDIFRAFWIIGICGGFTTFSTFGMDLFNLFQKDSWLTGCLYISANFFGTLLFIWIGYKGAGIIS